MSWEKSYARWDRLGFVFDDYRPVHPSTVISNLGTPWLRLCHRVELVAASQTSQWLGAGDDGDDGDDDDVRFCLCYGVP